MPRTKQIETDIQGRITAFVAELEGLVRAAALEGVQSAFATRGTTTKRRKKKATKRRAKKAARGAPAIKGNRVRRTADQVEALAARVQAHVKAKPGQRLGEIGKALRMSTKDVRRPAFALVEAGTLRTEGQRGGTRYFAGGGRKKGRGRKA